MSAYDTQKDVGLLKRNVIPLVDQRQAETFDLERITFEVRNIQAAMAVGIVEIGKRLSIVKQRLEHGEFGAWLDSVCIEQRTANRYMRAAAQFTNSTTLSTLSPSQVYEMCLLPGDVDRDEFVQATHVVPQTGETKRGFELSVRELRDVRKALESPMTALGIEGRAYVCAGREDAPEGDIERLTGTVVHAEANGVERVGSQELSDAYVKLCATQLAQRFLEDVHAKHAQAHAEGRGVTADEWHEIERGMLDTLRDYSENGVAAVERNSNE